MICVPEEKVADPKMPAPRKARSVGELLEDIIKEAFMMKASDVHLEPREKDLAVRYRVDGILQDIRVVEKSQESALIFKIKVMNYLHGCEYN